MNSPSKPAKAKTYMPEIRLAKLAKEAGGRLREDAIAAAETRVETLRDDGVNGIAAALIEIESVVKASVNGNLSREQFMVIQGMADRIITLSGTFGFKRLDIVARSLADLTNLLLTSGTGPVAPVLVHARAARLFAPKADPLPEEAAQLMLAELKKVREHFAPPPAAKPGSPGRSH
jgi:hypothetical protein